MSYMRTLTATIVLLSTVNAHMKMKTPTPYSAQDTVKFTNSPLTKANYPCQYTGSDADIFYARSSVTKMAVGEKQQLTFDGSAVHGGGSCQLAITSDLQPSSTTHWQVIMSIEGGCPSKDGSGPSEYDYTIPASTPPGQYSFAWTWMSKLAGQPELYMNCAPIEVTAGASSKRSVNSSMEIDSLVKRDALPDLWVGNIAGLNPGCTAVAGSDPVFPNPGPNEVKPEGGQRSFAATEGSNCCPENKCVGSAGGSAGASSSSNSSAPASVASAVGADASSAAGGAVVSAISSSVASAVSSEASSAPTSAAAGAQSSDIPLGFASGPATGPVSASSAAPSGSAVVSSALYSNSTTTTVVVTSAAAQGATSAAVSVAASATSSASLDSSSSTGGGMTGPCTTEGVFNCVGTQYQQCSSGSWTALRPLAAGTTCKQGQSMGLWAKRSDALQARRNGFSL